MGWLRRCWTWWTLRGWHERDGVWYGPRGQQLRAISGGQQELEEFASGLTGGDFSSGLQGPASADYSGALSREPSGFWDFASKMGAGIGKEFSDSPLKALTQSLGLGSMGLGIANQFNVSNQLGQQTKQIKQGQAQAQAAAAPAVAFGTETLNRAAGGNLTPALQAQIDQWTQQAKADATARMASMGLGNSTDINQLYALIDQQAMAMKGSMLQQQEETGLAGLQTGVSAATSSTGVSQSQQAQLANLIQTANQALGLIGGRSA